MGRILIAKTELMQDFENVKLDNRVMTTELLIVIHRVTKLMVFS